MKRLASRVDSSTGRRGSCRPAEEIRNFILVKPLRGFHASLGRGDLLRQAQDRLCTQCFLCHSERSEESRLLPLPSGEVDASPRASGEGARIELNACALTRRAKRAPSSPGGRGIGNRSSSAEPLRAIEPTRYCQGEFGFILSACATAGCTTWPSKVFRPWRMAELFIPASRIPWSAISSA
jgi:hypothetical protein